MNRWILPLALLAVLFVSFDNAAAGRRHKHRCYSARPYVASYAYPGDVYPAYGYSYYRPNMAYYGLGYPSWGLGYPGYGGYGFGFGGGIGAGFGW